MNEEDQEDDEEDEDEQSEEIKIDKGPNFNEFARFQNYGNYYRPRAFYFEYPQSYLQLQNQYNLNSSGQPQQSQNSYEQDGQNNYTNPYQNSVCSLKNHNKLKNYNQFQNPVYGILQNVNQVSNFASHIVCDPPDQSRIQSKYDQFQLFLSSKQQFQISQENNFLIGLKLAKQELSEPSPIDWRLRIKKEQYRQSNVQSQNQFDEYEYQEFLKFKNFFKMEENQFDLRNQEPRISTMRRLLYQDHQDESLKKQQFPNKEQKQAASKQQIDHVIKDLNQNY